MKNLIFLLIFSISFVSCGDTQTSSVTISKDEYAKLLQKQAKVEEPKQLVIHNYNYNIYTGSDGHDYLEEAFGRNDLIGHYVDCRLCKQRRNDTTVYKIWTP
jgi:hypothetical protein